MERIFNYDVMDAIKERWSPRAFSDKPVSEKTLMTLLEAARYAPSCNNEQPWLYIVGHEPRVREKILSVLNPGNQAWAKAAPVLLLILSRKTFERNDKDNYWHMFDAGTSWGFLSLQAHSMGLITHAMGGYNRDLAREVFEIPEHIDIIAAVAVGYYGEKEQLTEDLQNREKPSTRKGIAEIIYPVKE
ncbi:MAG: nitroreductase family protein [Firmicutes bacterium]|nr:nitroreductase family protein [Bacillota bacterium]